MRGPDLMLLYEFNYWARDRILSAAGQLSPAEFHAPVQSNFGSLQATLVHILSAEWIWRLRCQEGKSPASLLDRKDFPSLEPLHAFWAAEQSRMLDFLSGLDESRLDEPVAYRRTGGQEQSNTLWHILYHVVNHGTEHRAEAGAILTGFGHSPGDIDFIHFLRDREKMKT